MVNCSDPDPTLTETQFPGCFACSRITDTGVSARRIDRAGTGPDPDRRAAVNSRPGRVGVRPFVDSVRPPWPPVLQEDNFKEGDHGLSHPDRLWSNKQIPTAWVFWGTHTETGPTWRRKLREWV